LRKGGDEVRSIEFKKKEEKMSHLKKETVNKCISLLREYIEQTALNNKKEIAGLALNQLQKITAGTGSDDPDPDPSCHGRPTARSSEG
jgi:hypothetical protein